ncbi:hypothetical protein CHS0354_026009 [Potamilus streckersoni]|uniref:Uncharacterized protein n=1 Tax=Potamilus streckersoni TaxID=2493646 RepID=A0AAE0VKN6_9BIVA|nr:hypothetical protein CHS0354_026009 [Potamilus streckersoni]
MFSDRGEKVWEYLQCVCPDSEKMRKLPNDTHKHWNRLQVVDAKAGPVTKSIMNKQNKPGPLTEVKKAIDKSKDNINSKPNRNVTLKRKSSMHPENANTHYVLPIT